LARSAHSRNLDESGEHYVHGLGEDKPVARHCLQIFHHEVHIADDYAVAQAKDIQLEQREAIETRQGTRQFGQMGIFVPESFVICGPGYHSAMQLLQLAIQTVHH